jgi:hypothetical protein
MYLLRILALLGLLNGQQAIREFERCARLLEPGW